MQKLTTTVTCLSGLHNRQAALFTQHANDFKSSIWIESESRKINAKSLLGVMSMAVVTGTELTITAEGPDEQEAVTELANLLKADLS